MSVQVRPFTSYGLNFFFFLTKSGMYAHTGWCIRKPRAPPTGPSACAKLRPRARGEVRDLPE